MGIRLTPRAARACFLIGLLAIGTVACGDSAAIPPSRSATSPSTTSTAAGATAPTVSRQWARTSPAGATTGVAYFTVTSPTDDRLIGVAVDRGVAMMAQLHESTMGTDGQMSMQPAAAVELKAGTPLVLQPGGYHVMLMQLAAPLVKGGTVTLTLTFEKAGTLAFDVPVLDEAP